MKKTSKIYIQNPIQLCFGAQIIEVETLKTGSRIALDQTCFYAESGGQLGDRGILKLKGQSIEICDTQIEEGVVWHYTDQVIQKEGIKVEGQVNELHRKDMMQQHSGQHLLSAVCFLVLGAETVSARLGQNSSTLDLDVTDFSPNQRSELENQCQNWIQKNVPLIAHFPSADELPNFALRKAPTVKEDIRIMEIEGLDQTPCGGTHCSQSSEIGSVIITKWEKVRNTVRLHFLAGKRVLGYCQSQREILEPIAHGFGVAAAECPDQIERLRATIQELNQKNGTLRSNIARQLVKEALPMGKNVRLHSDDPDLFRTIAKHMASKTSGPISIFWPTPSGTRFVIEKGDACSEDLQSAMIKLREIGAKGGGKERIEGMIPPSEKAKTFMASLPEISDS